MRMKAWGSCLSVPSAEPVFRPPDRLQQYYEGLIYEVNYSCFRGRQLTLISTDLIIGELIFKPLLFSSPYLEYNSIIRKYCNYSLLFRLKISK
jgi:hypothetical protein